MGSPICEARHERPRGAPGAALAGLSLLLFASGACKDASSEPTKSSVCAAIEEEFARTLERAPGRCTTDGDCDSYPAGVGPAAGCGGATDVDTARELRRIAERFTQEHCAPDVLCRRRPVHPVCVEGRCVDRPSVGHGP